jgi:hypothetical protein
MYKKNLFHERESTASLTKRLGNAVIELTLCVASMAMEIMYIATDL